MDGTRLLNSTLLTMGLVVTSIPSNTVGATPLNTLASTVKYDGSIFTTRFLSQNSYSLDKLKFNKQKLKTYKNLKKKWDGYDGDEFDEDVIHIVECILSDLTIQPQVFPTSRGTIQIEKYFTDENFYEIEIGKDEIFAYIVTNEEEIEREVEIEELISLLSNLNV